MKTEKTWSKKSKIEKKSNQRILKDKEKKTKEFEPRQNEKLKKDWTKESKTEKKTGENRKTKERVWTKKA